jgi:NAD(P)-dependent dehydrogenase (short-subunit alcohol dehydrogenase family)
MEEKLRGRTALITGAGRRIGRAIALALAREGVNIIMHYPSNEDETQELQTELTAMGVRSWSVKADFEKAEEYETLIERSLKIAGSMDILINNASIFSPGTLAEVDFADLMRHMQVNGWAPFVLSRDFARLVGKGKIINLLDSRVSDYDWAHVAYIMSKHVLSIFTKMTAIEFAPEISVNGIAPGLILPPQGKDESYLDRLASTVPLKRHGGAEDITSAVTYLLTNDFLTGQIIYVDGGRHLMEYADGPHPGK